MIRISVFNSVQHIGPYLLRCVIKYFKTSKLTGCNFLSTPLRANSLPVGISVKQKQQHEIISANNIYHVITSSFKSRNKIIQDKF